MLPKFFSRILHRDHKPEPVVTAQPQPLATQSLQSWIDTEIDKALKTPLVTAKDPEDWRATAAARNQQLLRLRRLESMNTDPSLEDEFSDE